MSERIDAGRHPDPNESGTGSSPTPVVSTRDATRGRPRRARSGVFTTAGGILVALMVAWLGYYMLHAYDGARCGKDGTTRVTDESSATTCG